MTDNRLFKTPITSETKSIIMRHVKGNGHCSTALYLHSHRCEPYTKERYIRKDILEHVRPSFKLYGASEMNDIAYGMTDVSNHMMKNKIDGYEKMLFELKHRPYINTGNTMYTTHEKTFRAAYLFGCKFIGTLIEKLEEFKTKLTTDEFLRCVDFIKNKTPVFVNGGFHLSMNDCAGGSKIAELNVPVKINGTIYYFTCIWKDYESTDINETINKVIKELTTFKNYAKGKADQFMPEEQPDPYEELLESCLVC